MAHSPASPAVAQVLVEVAATGPGDASFCAWALPLTAAALAAAIPPAPVHTWLRASQPLLSGLLFAVPSSTALSWELHCVGVDAGLLWGVMKDALSP